MKATNRNLTDVFDKAAVHGIESLSAEERTLYLIQDFILEWENGNLSQYFYNRLPDVGLIAETVAATRLHGLLGLANILDEALALFRDYADPSEPTTWGRVLQRYDPDDRLHDLDSQVRELPDYGIPT